MKLNIMALALVLGLAGSMVFAQTKSGTISSNETWSGTITVAGDVVIQNAVVTVMPGTQVRFNTSNNNRVNGDATHICLILKSNGGLKAIGTAASPITFTTASSSKSKGMWGEIDLEANINVSQTTFQYCIFECGNNALDNRGSNANPQTKASNPITVANCTIRTMARSGFYITSAGSPTIRNCVFRDLTSSGIFAHGAENVTVENTFIYNVSVGIINVGEPTWGWNQKMTVNHVTIHHVDGDLASTSQWWTGHGIYCSGDSRQKADLSLTNTIISDVTYKNNPHTQSAGPIGLACGAGTETNDYNCWYQAGYRNIVGGELGAHAVEGNPLFTNPAGGDFSLKYGSPCLNKASDGTHIGAWQGAVGIGEQAGDNIGETRIQVRSLKGQVIFSMPEGFNRLDIYSLGGKPVRGFEGAAGNEVTWNGLDNNNGRMAAGIYFYRVFLGKQALQNAVMLVR